MKNIRIYGNISLGLKLKELLYLKNISLGDYVAYWYKIYKMPKHEKSTIAVQLNYIHTHIIPSDIGSMNFQDVRTADIQKFLGELLLAGNKCSLQSLKSFGKPLANCTVQKIRQILIAAYKQALKEGIVNHNYAADTDPIPKSIRSHIIFSIDHQQKFLSATKNHRFHLAYKLLFYTGCRRGEILGLSWNNINFKTNYIVINQTLVVENNMPILKNRTKTQGSMRTIPIPHELKLELRFHQRKQADEKQNCSGWNNPENLVFVNTDGSPHHPKYFSRNFKETVKRLGFPASLHIHSARHTFATNMLQLGIPITDVQALGGWTTPTVLLSIYAHTVQKSHKKAILKLFKSV